MQRRQHPRIAVIGSGFGGIYNSCYDVSALSTWVRQGWAPRNTHLGTAAHDGTFIGALPPVGTN